MSDNNTAFRPPNPVVVAQWAGMARHILSVGGALLAAFGVSMPTWLANLTDPQISIIVSVAMVAVGAAMSAWAAFQSWRQKQAARDVEVAGAVASAEIGVPVTVTVTPPGVPNVASRVSATEAASAPVVPAGVTPSPAPRAA